MTLLGNFKKKVRTAAKETAYSPIGRRIARSVTRSSDVLPIKRLVAAKGLEEYMRRLSSESLLPGTYYAKLSVSRWKAWEGKRFRLSYDNKIVFEEIIEAPKHGTQLVYRNIIVESDDASKFTVDIDVPHKLAISRGDFSSPQQQKYDQNNRITQVGDIHYALRGNLKNPENMVIMFPAHGESSASITYKIDRLSNLTESDLKSTLVVSLQDRYQQNGTFLTVDNSGRDLTQRVFHAIDSLSKKYGIPGKQIVFSGRREGGTMAIVHARHFPESRLLLVEPKMSLGGPHEDGVIVLDPRELINSYLAQGRNIELIAGLDGSACDTDMSEEATTLTVYRLTGEASVVNRATNVTLRALISQFIGNGNGNGNGKVTEFSCEELRVFWAGESARVQLRIGKDPASVSGSVWFMEGALGSAKYLQLISDHKLPFVKYSNEHQAVFGEFDAVGRYFSAVALESNGDRWHGDFPTEVVRPGSLMKEQQSNLEG